MILILIVFAFTKICVYSLFSSALDRSPVGHTHTNKRFFICIHVLCVFFLSLHDFPFSRQTAISYTPQTLHVFRISPVDIDYVFYFIFVLVIVFVERRKRINGRLYEQKKKRALYI